MNADAAAATRLTLDSSFAMLADAAASTLLASALLFPVLTRHRDDLQSGIKMQYDLEILTENCRKTLKREWPRCFA